MLLAKRALLLGALTTRRGAPAAISSPCCATGACRQTRPPARSLPHAHRPRRTGQTRRVVGTRQPPSGRPRDSRQLVGSSHSQNRSMAMQRPPGHACHAYDAPCSIPQLPPHPAEPLGASSWGHAGGRPHLNQPRATPSSRPRSLGQPAACAPLPSCLLLCCRMRSSQPLPRSAPPGSSARRCHRRPHPPPPRISACRCLRSSRRCLPPVPAPHGRRKPCCLSSRSCCLQPRTSAIPISRASSRRLSCSRRSRTACRLRSTWASKSSPNRRIIATCASCIASQYSEAAPVVGRGAGGSDGDGGRGGDGRRCGDGGGDDDCGGDSRRRAITRRAPA